MGDDGQLRWLTERALMQLHLLVKSEPRDIVHQQAVLVGEILLLGVVILREVRRAQLFQAHQDFPLMERLLDLSVALLGNFHHYILLDCWFNGSLAENFFEVVLLGLFNLLRNRKF